MDRHKTDLSCIPLITVYTYILCLSCNLEEWKADNIKVRVETLLSVHLCVPSKQPWTQGSACDRCWINTWWPSEQMSQGEDEWQMYNSAENNSGDCQ
jgi:hypothetical protein